MKKLLNILSVAVLISSTITSIIACCSIEKLPTVKTDISKKIGNVIDLGWLSANTAVVFKNTLQTKLTAITDLSKITVFDYDVYKATTTSAITDSDVVSATSLSIKIVGKGNNFTGIKDNIKVNYIIKTINLNTIITNKELEKIFVSKKLMPNKKEILSAIKIKNPTASNLTESDFSIKATQSASSATLNGIGQFIGEVVINYTCNNLLKMLGTTGIIFSLTTDRDGNIYAGGDNGVYKSNGKNSFDPKPKKTVNSSTIVALTTDRDGNIYAGASKQDSLFKSSGTVWDTTTFQKINTVHNLVNSLVTSKIDGSIYVGTDNGVYRSNDGNIFTKILGTEGKIYSLTIDANGNVYAGNISGSLFQKTNSSNEFIKTPLPEQSIKFLSLTTDQNGTVYVGTANGDILKVKEKDYQQMQIQAGAGSIISLATDKDANVYAASRNGTIYKNLYKTDSFTPLTTVISSGIWSLIIDRDDIMYVGAGDSVYKS